MADFKTIDTEILRTVRAGIASATVIEPGDLVDLTSGLVTKATAASTVLALCPGGSANGETVTEITVGNNFDLLGTGDAVFAVTMRGALRDMVVNSGTQQIDVATSSTNVFKIHPGIDAGTVGSASNIRVKINLPVY